MINDFLVKHIVIFLLTLGNIHLQFHSSGNHYVWSKVTSTVHNIIVGKLWIDQVCPSRTLFLLLTVKKTQPASDFVCESVLKK